MNHYKQYYKRMIYFLIQRSRVVREEGGEEKHPSVGKEINRPKCPNKPPLAMRFLIGKTTVFLLKKYGLFSPTL